MSAQVKTSCPHCQISINVPPELFGRRVRCPDCRNVFDISNVSFISSTPELQSGLGTQQEGDTENSEEWSAEQIDELPLTAKPQPPATGQVGRFELKRSLGQGSFGRVYLAYDSVLDRQVALKVPRFDRTDEKRVRRFLTEAKAAAQLRHPNIVTVFESGQAEDELFIASEYVSGEPLSKRISSGAIEPRQAAQWVHELADALAYAHSEGVIHRDIKPENIMINAKGRPQIMDFGLAKRIDAEAEATADGSILGTPAYMSPEQARGDLDNVGPASDQYSLGVTLYELLTGRRPFEGGAHAVIHAVISEEPKPPRQINPTIPKDLEAICLKAMDKDPRRRYPLTADFAKDLDRWLASRPVVARPIGLMERLQRWSRRNPVVAALEAATVLIFVVGLSVSLWQWSVAQAHFRQAERNRIDAERLQKLAQSNLKTAEQERSWAIRERDRAKKAEEDLQRTLGKLDVKFKEVDQLRVELDEKNKRLEDRIAELSKSKTTILQRDAQVKDQRQKLESIKRRQAYVTDIEAASKSVKQNDVPRIRELLNKWLAVEPGADDLRGFEWHYLARSYGTWSVDAIAPDRWIKRISWDGRFIELSKWPPGEEPAGAKATDSHLIWDTVKQAALNTESMKLDPYVLAVMFQTPFSWLPQWSATQSSIQFPVGDRSIVGRSGRTHFASQRNLSRFNWIAASPPQLLSFGITDRTAKGPPAMHDARWVTFSRDGSVCAFLQGDGTLCCLRVATGSLIKVDYTPTLTNERPDCWLSPRGNFLVLGTRQQDVQRCVILALSNRIPDVQVGDRAVGVVTPAALKRDSEPEFALDESCVVLCSEDEIRSFSLLSTTPRNPVPLAKVSETGPAIALTEAGTILLFDRVKIAGQRLNLVSQKKERYDNKDIQTIYWPGRTLPHLNADTDSSVLSRHAELLNPIDAGQPSIRFNSALLGSLKGEEHTLVRAHDLPIQRLIIDQSGDVATTQAENGEVKSWSLPSGRLTGQLQVPTRGLQICPSVNPLELLVSRQSIVEIWNAPLPKRSRALTNFPDKMELCCNTPDGRQIVLQSGKDRFEVWNTIKVEKSFEWPLAGSRILVYAISPDGRIVAGTRTSGTIDLFQTIKNGTINYIKNAGNVRVMQFSPDGRLLATGDDRGTIHVWDVVSGEIRADIPAHRGSVTCLAFSLDGNNFLSGSVDQTIKAWDLDLGKLRYTFDGHTAALVDLAFTPDGRTLVSADKNGSLRIWRGK